MSINIVKLQDELRSVPLQNLITYVSSPNGQVPSYLALAEIKRRKDMEERATANQATAPRTSVAQDLTAPKQNIAMAQPMQQAPQEQGVAGLPTGDMYHEKNFAGGGIVAFSGQDGVSDVASKKYQAWQQDTMFDPQHLYAGAMDAITAPFKYRTVYDPNTGTFVKASQAYGMTPRLDALNAERQTEKQAILNSIPEAKPGLPSLVTKPDNTLTNEDIASIYASTKQNAPAPRGPASVDTTGQAPSADVTRPMNTVTAKPGIDSLLENTDNVAEDKMARYQQMMGVNPERARLQDLVTKYETGAGEQERMAPWMALTKAGFTMMGGKSPYAMQNISEGAVAGLSDYAQAKDRLDKLNEKQIDLRSKLLQVDDARKSAAVTYGVNSEEHALARNAQVKLKDMEEQNANARADAQNATHIKGAQIAAAKESDYETYIKMAKQDPDNYKTIIDPETKKATRAFDATKVTQAFKSWSGGSTGATDKELMDIWNQKSFDKKFLAQYPSPADFVSSYRQKISSGNAGVAPAANPSLANRKPLGSILGQ